MRIHIVQPVIPHYRVPFFKELYKNNEDLEFYASDRDDIDVQSVPQNIFKYTELGKVKRFKGVVWQSGIFNVIFRFRKNDKLVINGNPRYISNFLVIMLARIIGVKVIWWGQGWSSNTTSFTFKVRTYLMGLADAVILYTDKEKSLFPKTKLKGKVFALNNGLDNRVIKKLCINYNPTERKNEILFIGRLTDKSKLDNLIRAISSIDSSIILNVIGDGPNLNKYEHLTKLLGLTGRVKFWGSIVDEERIATIANSSKVFVYPGNVGLSLIHAFNYGLPAIVHSTTSKHMPEISCFEKNLTGEEYNLLDESSLGTVIENLILDSNKLMKYSLECKRRVSVSYNIEAMVSNFYKAIESVQ